MKRLIALVLVLAFCLTLCACGGKAAPTEPPTEAPTEPPEPTVSPEELARQAAYHEKMADALRDVDRDQVKERKATKAVALVRQRYVEEDKGRYVDTYVDPKRVAKEPEEVRFVVRCSFFDNKVGIYTAGGGIAYEHCVKVSVIDLSKGSSPRFEEIFSGGEPPATVSGHGNHYGPEVDPEVIIEWSESAIEKLLNT